jgi:hypothetical protein
LHESIFFFHFFPPSNPSRPAPLPPTISPFAWGFAAHTADEAVDRPAVFGTWNCVDLRELETLGPAGRITRSDDADGCGTLTLAAGAWKIEVESMTFESGASQLRVIDADSAGCVNFFFFFFFFF